MNPGILASFKRKTATSNYASIVAADGANHLWLLNETSGATAVDSIGGANGTYVNSPTLNQPGPGSSLRAAVFDGSTQLVSNTTSIVQNTNFSYDFWFKSTVAQGGPFGVSDTGNNSISPSGWDKFTYINTSSQLVVGVYNNNSLLTISVNNLLDGNWHYVAVVFTSSQTLLYIDGSLSASMNYVSAAADNKITIGYCYDFNWPGATSSYYFNGAMSAVATYPVALTAAQILNHYNAGKT